jgi:hypothetical protein
MNYGGIVPTITPTYSGFVNGDTQASLTVQPQCATAATAASAAGSYSSSCTGAVDANYDISYVEGSVTIAPVALSIAAGNGTMPYGSNMPTISPTYSGFVNGDSQANLSVQPQCTTTATSSSALGSYPSSCTGAVDSNYTIAYLPGTVSVIPDAIVDFSQTVTGQKSMSGFLYGINPATAPPSSMIDPLAPHLWRGSFGNSSDDDYSISQSLGDGTIFDEVVSDNTYGYPGQGTWNKPNSVTPPFNNAPYTNAATIATYESDVQGVAAKYASRNAYWEVWNEPTDIVNATDYFWYGDAQQFYPIYLAGYLALRAQLGSNVLIVGPSTSYYNKTFITGLLSYCVANGCEVNVLSWHEFPDSNIPQIAQDLEDARGTILNNSAYAAANIQQIFVNETVGPAADYEPGDIVAYLYFLEQGGADAAAKGCWNDPQGTGECFDNSLDGLIDPANFSPRAPWWAYKLYSDGVSTRISVPYTNGPLVALASSGSATPQTAQVLVGYFDQGTPAATADFLVQLTNLNSLSFLSGSTSAQVGIQKIPNAGSADVAVLTPVSTTTIAIQNNSLTVPITGIALHETYVISISQ